jgi:hypothetical protein
LDLRITDLSFRLQHGQLCDLDFSVRVPAVSDAAIGWQVSFAALWRQPLCMGSLHVFFQAMLVLGYAYSHFLFGSFSPKQQTRTHLSLLALSLLWLIVSQSDGEAALLTEVSRKVEAHETLAFAVLSFLASNAGLPFFLLASTSPLLQGWLSLAYPAASPYRLYSLQIWDHCWR